MVNILKLRAIKFSFIISLLFHFSFLALFNLLFKDSLQLLSLWLFLLSLIIIKLLLLFLILNNSFFDNMFHFSFLRVSQIFNSWFKISIVILLVIGNVLIILGNLQFIILFTLAEADSSPTIPLWDLIFFYLLAYSISFNLFFIFYFYSFSYCFYDSFLLSFY